MFWRWTLAPWRGEASKLGYLEKPPGSLPPNQNQHHNYIEGGNWLLLAVKDQTFTWGTRHTVKYRDRPWDQRRTERRRTLTHNPTPLPPPTHPSLPPNTDVKLTWSEGAGASCLVPTVLCPPASFVSLSPSPSLSGSASLPWTCTALQSGVDIARIVLKSGTPHIPAVRCGHC